MIFADQHHVANGNELAARALELFPNPDELIGQTLKVSGVEERGLDSIAGMFWPAILLNDVTNAYRAAGHTCNGFVAGITFFDDNTAVLVTFKKLEGLRTSN